MMPLPATPTLELGAATAVTTIALLTDISNGSLSGARVNEPFATLSVTVPLDGAK
jgi:hypothetical protein